MNYYEIPHFVVKNDLQKSKQTNIYFSDIVTADVLKDVCYCITGLTNCTYEYVGKEYKDEFLDSTYNMGRIAILKYRNYAMYISFSEKGIVGRNSSVQSVPTAFNMYYNNTYPHKKLYYYFLDINGNAETDYLILIYRLMKTIGFEFLNANSILKSTIHSFSSIDDIMNLRQINSGKNRSNNSTFITKSTANQIEVYGKTYGANKYETSMICYVLSLLAEQHQTIVLYEMVDNDLKELPASSLSILKKMGKIKLVKTDTQLEKKIFNDSNSLRSPHYLYNLFNRLGKKHCAFCNCEIPELIQGAHVWPVSSIKKENLLPFDKKLQCAVDGENGLWLCENHHKLFDENILFVSDNGKIQIKPNIDIKNTSFIKKITSVEILPNWIMSDKFVEYLHRRNKDLLIA